MSEKTHKPTPRRLREARKRGEVVRSRDVGSFASFMAFWICLWVSAGNSWSHLAHLIGFAARAADPVAGSQPWTLQMQSMLLDAAWVLLPLLGVSVLLAALVGVLQTRGLISFVPLTPRFERINPAQGLRNLFSMRQLFELVKMGVKMILLLAVLVYFIGLALDTLVRQVYSPAEDVLHLWAALCWRLMGWAAVVYALAAVLDYAHQYYEFMKKQKMSIEDLRQEHRDTEGDPHIRNRRRALAREHLFSDFLTRLPPASVVVANPTHVAVALYYEPGTTPLPRVVAKGADALALRIRTLAQRGGVPVLEDRPLARRLYREVAVGHYIKDELIDAVAAVFRWVRLMEEQRRGSVQLAVAETESDAPYGVNQPGEVGPVDLAPQPGDVHVNDVVQGGGTSHVFPNLVR